jgi:predicted ester cyclase
MAEQIVELARGNGSLHGGGVRLREVPYRLFRRMDRPVTPEAGGSSGPIEGSLDIAGIAEATVLAGVDDLVLQCEDGQQIAIALTSSGGSFLLKGAMRGTDGLRDFARRYTEAWCGQDAAKVAAFFSADGSLTVNDQAPAIGRAAITGVAQGFMSAFPDLQVLMDDVVEDGPRVTYRWTLVGTNAGPGGTGRPVRISGFEEWQLAEDGLIARSLGHFDAQEYQRQLDGRST